MEIALKECELAMVGCKNGSEPRKFVKQLRVVAKIVDAVRIEYDQTVIRQTPNEARKKLLHVAIPPQTRSNDPAMNGLFPSFYLSHPFVQHRSNFLRGANKFLL